MVILRDPDSEGGGGSTRTEKIQLLVECPPQDFSTKGGIKDAMAALDLLNNRFNATRENLSRGFSIGGSSSGSVTSSGEIRLNISGSAIQASLIAGEKIKLNLSASDFIVTGGQPTSGQSGMPPGGSVSPGGVPPSGGGGRILSQTTSETAEGDRLRRRRYAAGDFDRSYREVTYDDKGDPKTSTLHDQFASEGAAGVANTILEKKNELQQKILQGALAEAEAHKILAKTIEAEAHAAEDLNALQKSRYFVAADALRMRAGRLENRTANRAQIGMFRDYFSAQDEAQDQASRNIEARRLRRQREEDRSQRTLSDNTDQINQAYARARSEARIELGNAFDRTRGMNPAEARRSGRQADVLYHERLQGAAHDIVSATAGVPGMEKVNQDYTGKLVQHYHDAQSAASSLRLETDRVNESTRLIGKNMIQNIKHVSTWALSVGVLYGSLELLKRSLSENMEIGREMAVLSVVFKGGADAVGELTSGVMALATANGQVSREAVESATEWSRLFRTQKDVIDGTNASLILANTSGEEAAKTTEFLSMMVQVYKLRASELNGVIGEMARISQTANVTQKDLMKGMEAAGEAAKEAGMSYSQTFGLIAGGVSATKQSGTSIGNTIKTMVTQMANPEIQNRLRFGSGIEVTEGGSGMREMPQIINEIYVAYQRMTRAERESLLFNVGGRQNATRLAGILDQYIAGQMEAIDGQLHLNAAQLENSRIMDTLKGQTAALVAEWDRFTMIQGQGTFGPMQALTDMSRALKEVLQLANAPGFHTLVTLIGAMSVGMGARMLVSGLASNAASSAEAGIKCGIVVSTVRALKNDAAALGTVFGDTAQVGALRLNQALMLIPGATARIAPGMYEMGTAAKFAAVGFAALTDVILPLLAVWGTIKAINYMAEGGRSTADAISEAERAKSAMSAHSDRASLIGTASAALGDLRTPASRRADIARQIATAQLPFGSAAQISQLEKQNQLLIEQGRLTELLGQLDKSRVAAQQDSTRERLNGKNAIQQQIMLEQEHLDQINKFQHTGRWSGGRAKMLLGGEFIPLAADYLHGFDATVSEAKKHIGELRDELKDFNDEARRASEDTYARSEIRAGVIGASQSLAFQGMGAQFGSLGTPNPIDEYNRKLAQLTAQQGYLNQQRTALDAPGAFGLNPDPLFKARQSAMEEYIKNSSELGAMQMPGARRMFEDQTRLGIYNKFGRSEFESFARAPGRGERGLTFGWTEGEQLVNQSILGQRRLDHLNHEQGPMREGEGRQRNAEALQIEIGLMENKMTAQLKIIELTKEEINLNAQARKEFERSLLTSSPSDLLRMAATNRLSHGRRVGEPGGIGAGEFFALSQQSREDLFRMPGNTAGERDARRAREALERQFGRQSPFDMGEDAVHSSISASRYGGLVSAPSPQFSIPDAAISAIMDLGNASAVAAQHLASIPEAIDAIVARAFGHHAAGAGAPPIAQHVPNWQQR